MQSIPSQGLLSLFCLDFTSISVSMGDCALLSAKAKGIESRASAKDLKAYCSRVEILKTKLGCYLSHSKHFDSRNKTELMQINTLLASSLTAKAQEISAAPPPYTILLSLTKFRTTQRASCRLRLASSMIYKNINVIIVFVHAQILKLKSTFSTNHLISTTDEDGDGSRILALFNNQHFIMGGPKRNFLDKASITKLTCS